MAEYLVNSGSGVTEMALSTAYVLGDRIVINRASTGTNYKVARAYVWECTTAGTTASTYPAYSTSYTPDTSTMTSGTAVFTCRNPGFSSGTTKDWTFASPLFAYAQLRAVADGDVIKVHKTHIEEWAMGISLQFQASVSVICVDKDNNEVRSTMGTTAYIATGTAAYNISITAVAAVRSLYMYGITFRTGINTNSYSRLLLSQSAPVDICYENCTFWNYDAYTLSTVAMYLTEASSNYANYSRFIGCVFRFNYTGAYISAGSGRVDLEGCSIDPLGVTPSLLLDSVSSGGYKRFTGCDLSAAGATLVGNIGNSGLEFIFVNCKFPAGVTILAAQSYGQGGGNVSLFNCASGDTHYNWGMYSGLGSVESITSIYANDGALYDGTNHVTWKIVTTALCSDINPFCTPWMEKYNSTLSAITPSIEILRDGSTTAFTDAEVWGEFAYQGTVATTRDSFVNDRMEYPPSLITSPANQAAGVGLAGWTGEAASAWSGKLAPGASITPAVIGMLRARVWVATPSTTVYVDPKIR